jgi:S-adenosylmethionine:tRNA ribosyltransferase-isomerase
LADYDFELPEELIAQEPLPRGTSRLMILDRGGGPPSHGTFPDIVDALPRGCVLVLNETQVVPARFLGQRATGGKAEVMLVRPRADGPGAELAGEGAVPWEAIVRCGGSLRPPEEVLELEGGAARLRLLANLGAGRYQVEFLEGDALSAAERCGRMPLPPYIRREADAADRERYQTVFARVPGAIAAPTAGLHFTPELLAAVEAKGVVLARLVLHVGPGTFLPIRSAEGAEHRMAGERYEIPAAARRTLEQAKAAGRPVVACGTTAVRALEGWGASGEASGETDLFITPGHSFRWVDGLITNFHLPKSTLLLLVSALAGREAIRAAYAEAVAQRYRFYSYGDAMFIPPA